MDLIWAELLVVVVSVAATALMLIVPGGLQPTAMQRTLRVIDDELAAFELAVDPPCDAEGNPT